MEDNQKDIKELLAQKRIINTIINKGIKFSVEYTVKVRQKGLFGFFKPKVYETHSEEFTLKECTLNTLDRATVVWLRMQDDIGNIDKEGVDKENKANKFVHAHAHDMAECLAIIALGEKYNAVEGGDDEELGRLTDLFYKTIKPSQISDIATFISVTRNVADFMTSTRMMMMSMTMTPTNRVE